MTAALMALLAAGAVVFVLSPLTRRAPPVPPGDARARLLQAREAACQALRDADFDHATGKMTDADYAEFRARYEERAQAIRRRLEAPDPGDAVSGGDSA